LNFELGLAPVNVALGELRRSRSTVPSPGSARERPTELKAISVPLEDKRNAEWVICTCLAAITPRSRTLERYDAVAFVRGGAPLPDAELSIELGFGRERLNRPELKSPT
jgi:hypothetical protein